MLNWLKTHWYIPVGGIILLSPQKSIAAIARLTDGIKEIGYDSGFSSKKFQAEMIGLKWQPGWAWCVMYAKYVWSHWLKGAKRKRAMELISANSQVTWNNFKNDKSGLFILTTDKPRHEGAIVIWTGALNNGTGHAGIVRKIPKDYKSFVTVEGNYGNQVKDDITRYYNFTTANSEGLILKGFINVK